jgi:SAM-dependent methyltransferase
MLRLMTGILSLPQLYHACQLLGGFFDARLKTFGDYLEFSSINKVFDVGCGPGHISAKIPPSIEYIGFDSDEKYIRFAKARFGGPKRRFYNRLFDPTATAEFGNPDLIMMNGLLHHVDDDYVRTLLIDAYNALNPGGIVFTHDPCFADGQSPIARYLLKSDRGKFVRTEQGYRSLLPSEFDKIDINLRHDIARVPYTFIVTRLQKLR